MSREKQIEEMARTLCGEKGHSCEKCDSHDMCEFWIEASTLYNAGYRKQSEECEKRIINQREELSRLNKRIYDLMQSRGAWKKQSERVGRQLHEVLSKQEWISVEERLPEANTSVLIYAFFHNQWQIVKGWHSCCDKKFHIPNSDYPSLTDIPVTHWMPLPEAPKMKGGAE